METKFQTSFIPKTTLDPISTNKGRRPMGFFTFISTIIFFITVLVSGGAFAWHRYLDSSKVSLQTSLEKNIKSFEPQTLDAYVRLNSRIDSAKELLSKHVAVSYIFDFLSENTIQSVNFDDFKYQIDPDGTASLSLNGQAKSYNAVAYQAEVFGKERSLRIPLFSNLDLDKFGNVIFNFTATVDPGFITYTRKAGESTASAQAAEPDNIVNTPSNDPLLLDNTQGTSGVDTNELDALLNSNQTQ